MAQNHRQMIRDIFHGRDPGGVVWQPRIDFWYSVNQKRGTLPMHLKNASLVDVYDYCHASVRYFNFPLRQRLHNVEIVEAWEKEKSLRRTWNTPVGSLTEVVHYDDYGISRYNTEYLLKTADDFRIYQYILENEEWWWDQAAYDNNIQCIGSRGLTQFWSRRSPVQSLFIESMGFENTILFMADHPDVVERYIEVHTRADDAMYDVLCANPFPIFNFGENIDFHMDSPSIWRKNLLPYYRKRVKQLHEAGIHTCIHVDGAMKRLLKDLVDCPTESIEACTPVPQGDVTLEEIQDALGGKILQDGIPAVYFLPSYPLEEMRGCTEQVVRLFYPRLILGISDELPPDSDIERVRMVGEWVQEMV